MDGKRQVGGMVMKQGLKTEKYPKNPSRFKVLIPKT